MTKYKIKVSFVSIYLASCVLPSATRCGPDMPTHVATRVVKPIPVFLRQVGNTSMDLESNIKKFYTCIPIHSAVCKFEIFIHLLLSKV